VSAALAVLARPGLWGTAIRQIGALAPAGWWRESPRLPFPAPDYLRFRLVTQYGDPEHRPEAADVVAYLEWTKSIRHKRRAV
jgi:hypothetical protein